MKHPVALIILDGLGLAPDGPGNAVSRAETPFLNRLASDFPHCTVSASGEDVGLPAGQMGNSEVGLWVRSGSTPKSGDKECSKRYEKEYKSN